jgi:hypothetical protein
VTAADRDVLALDLAGQRVAHGAGPDNNSRPYCGTAATPPG